MKNKKSNLLTRIALSGAIAISPLINKLYANNLRATKGRNIPTTQQEYTDSNKFQLYAINPKLNGVDLLDPNYQIIAVTKDHLFPNIKETVNAVLSYDDTWEDYSNFLQANNPNEPIVKGFEQGQLLDFYLHDKNQDKFYYLNVGEVNYTPNGEDQLLGEVVADPNLYWNPGASIFDANDNFVDANDLEVLSNNWLNPYTLSDYSSLARYWQKDATPDPNQPNKNYSNE
jgi:hypothetical protein